MAVFGKFLKDNRAVIATEFALVAPILALLWVGVIEFATAHLVARKVEAAAQSVADIIAQDEETNTIRLGDIQLAINAILDPYPTGTMGFQFSSIEEDADGVNTIGWRVNGGTLDGAPAPDPTIANDFNSGNDSVIVVTIAYVHTPIIFNADSFSWLSPTIDLSKTVFARPRRVPQIQCPDCP